MGQEDLLEKEMTTHFSILVWEIPWKEEPGRVQSVKQQRVTHDLATRQKTKAVDYIILPTGEFFIPQGKLKKYNFLNLAFKSLYTELHFTHNRRISGKFL